MALGSEMIDGVRSVFGKDTGHGGSITDIRVDKDVVDGRNRRQIVEVTGIGEFVDGDHPLAIGDQCPHQSRADKAGAAGYDHGHNWYAKISGCAGKCGSMRSRSDSITSISAGQAIAKLGSSQAIPRSCAGL